ncbi:MAG: dihydropteroate synthase, partial [Proteobacteria bacterium]|nr:dihydropteroate synthase [Pseudomonadota bacterium]
QEIYDFLSSRVSTCIQKGINPDQIVVDPGFGFGKTKAHNLTLMKSLDKFIDLSASLMVGVSRKAFIRSISGFEKGFELDQASAVVAAIAVKNGAGILRVHDVASTVSMLRLFNSLNLVSFSESVTVD